AYAAATGEREFQPWLYDLAVYAMYSVVGGTGLVIVKAMLVAGLAVVLLRVGRTGPGWLIPVVCTVLAILAISTRVPLRPVVASYFLLALTMWLLCAPRAAPVPTSAIRPPWPFLLIFIVWVNVDRWFVVGLAIVALAWLGQAADISRAKSATDSGPFRSRFRVGQAGLRFLVTFAAV